jgi:uncharacterized integral membrane protein
MLQPEVASEVYQGQFGTFTIDDRDRLGVIIYRGALMLSAVSFGAAVLLLFSNWGEIESGKREILDLISWLCIPFAIGLGIALAMIHIYLVFLHRTLQIFWAIGCVSAIGLAIQNPDPLVLTVYQYPLTLFGVGFIFAALTGIFFKEAFCFNRWETKILTLLVPTLLLGHLIHVIPATLEASLLATWALLFLIFAVRKSIQAIPPDIGDKSVFEHLHQRSHLKNGN